MRQYPRTTSMSQNTNIGFSYDMYEDVKEQIARRRGTAYTEEFVKGLPVGLELPSGVIARS